MSTPLFQEALIEAKKLREAAANEAKNAVLEAVSPIIKQMIDREISGVILEQEEPTAPEMAAGDAMPPPPPAPSPDAGAVPPVDAVPAAGAEVPPSPMPGMSPAVAKAAPPIVAPEGTSVPGKFETDPATGQPQIVLNINDLFTKTAPEAAMGTEAPPAETPAPESVSVSPAEAPGGPSAEMPEATPTEEAQPAALAEIYRAVNRLLAEQKKKSLKEQATAPTPATPPAAPPTDPNTAAAPAVPAPITPASTAAAPVDPNAAAATPPAPTATPGMTPDQMMAAAPPAAPGAVPPAPVPPPAAPGAVPPAAPAAPADPNAAATPPAAPAAAPPAPVMEYKTFKANLEKLEETVKQIGKRGSLRSSFIKENHEKEVLSLYRQLVGLRSKNAISSRVFGHNEERLDLLNENLNLIYSYTKNPLTKEINTMKTKSSLRDFARSLFEGSEGFEKEVGHVDPAGDSEGGSAEHAHKVSGNPKGVRAEAEKAKFPTKEKSAWPGKPEPTSLLEQLEEEIAEMMDGMHEEDEEMHMEQDDSSDGADEAVLEMNDEEVMAEARKARARLKALREQAEEEASEEGGDDHLSLTIDLDGVSGDEVENVNVSIDGEDLDVDMGGEEGGEEGMEMSDEEEAPEAEEDEEEVMMEARKAVRAAIKPVNETVTLRKQLDETQLLTARSLYLNKLFVRDDLSGAQKRKIVEYLDSARTIAEAKEIYNRVTRVLNTAKKSGVVTESATRPAGMLNEAVEPSFDTTRWQILAGVKKTAK